MIEVLFDIKLDMRFIGSLYLVRRFSNFFVMFLVFGFCGEFSVFVLRNIVFVLLLLLIYFINVISCFIIVMFWVLLMRILYVFLVWGMVFLRIVLFIFNIIF